MNSRDPVSRWAWRGGTWSVRALMVFGGVAGQVAAQTPSSTVFVDVSVVPMDRERVLFHQTVVVREGRITDLGPVRTVVIPVGAVRIDGRGKFLLPGLADMHAHVSLVGKSAVGFQARFKSNLGSNLPATRRQLFLYLANGITTIRLMRSHPDALALRAQAATGAILSPRMYVAADPVRGNISLDSDSLASIAPYIESAKRAGYDLLKVYAEEGAALDTIAAVARRVGLPIAGHPPQTSDDTAAIGAAVRAGFTSVEHLLGVGYGGGQTTPAQLLANARTLKRAGVWVCPTLVHVNGQDFAQPYPELRYLRAKHRITGVNQADSAGNKAHNDAVKSLQDVGVGLLLGTDAGSGPIWGFSIHRELEALVAAGLRPYEALVTGTRNPAVYFGTLDSAGTVAIDKRADLILLSGNPLEDIRHTANPAGVMLGGRWLSRGELDPILALLEGTLDDM